MHNLLKQWLVLKGNDASASMRKDAIHYYVGSNLQSNSTQSHRYYIGNDYYQLINRRIGQKHIGLMIGEALRNGCDDIEDILDWLNTYSNRSVRQCICWDEILNKLFSVDIVNCSDCHSLEHNDNVSWAYNDYLICESCRDRNYYWSDSRDTYVRDDDDEEDDDGIIGEYHSSSECFDGIPSSHDQRKKPIYLGLELEVEVNDSADRSGKAEELLNAIGSHRSEIDGSCYQYALCEHDGSLDHGFEIVTNYTGLDIHAKQLEFFKNRWRSVRSHDTSTCGLHIHICKSDMSLYHASKLVLFINDPSNERLIYALARRDSDSYAKFHDKKGNLAWLKGAKQYDNKRHQLQNLNGDRYEALNFQNSNTIEFRLFKGTLKYQTIMACLEFTYASWFFTLEAGLSDLNISKFLEFISKPENKQDTAHLRAYLTNKAFTLPSSGIVKQNPRITPVRESIEA
jgi:hypothetical protein